MQGEDHLCRNLEVLGKTSRTSENQTQERGRARERHTTSPWMNRRYSNDEQDRHDKQSEWKYNGQDGRYIHINENQGSNCHGNRYSDQGWRDRQDTIISHTNKHRIRLPCFDQGQVNLKQVKILTQALGEKYSYDGKHGAADFINNAVNMFKSQSMTEDTFKFLLIS